MPLLDKSALAACLAYVDLNPIRARIAETPETSRFTSVYERIHMRRQPIDNPVADKPVPSDQHAAVAEPHDSSRKLEKLETGRRAAWLTQFELSEATQTKPVPGDRASNKGCLAMSFAEYLQLLDWTGRQLRQDKRRGDPGRPGFILERLQVSDEGWLQLMGRFSRLFQGRRTAAIAAT